MATNAEPRTLVSSFTQMIENFANAIAVERAIREKETEDFVENWLAKYSRT